MRKSLIIGFILVAVAASGYGRTLLTQQQALATAFPGATSIERETLFLRPSQIERVVDASGQDFSQELVIRYVAKQNGRLLGYAYFDVHRVRTLPETIMVVVAPSAEIVRIDILTFSEPMDYFPRERWLDQFNGRRLDAELSLKKAIRPISGATLTGRAITEASRRILAIHQTVTSSKVAGN